jgi:hypothetical protein
MSIRPVENISQTIPFDQFWTWLCIHHNCIVRAGTPDTLLFDHDDYHWHLFTEDDGAHIVQLVRGKELIGEMVVIPNDIAYVQSEPAEPNVEGEQLFECVIEMVESRDVAYHFVMAHAFDEQPSTTRRWTH